VTPAGALELHRSTPDDGPLLPKAVDRGSRGPSSRPRTTCRRSSASTWSRSAASAHAALR